MMAKLLTIRFVSGGHWDSRVIEYWTRCEWSHVEAISSTSLFYTFGAMLRGGVRWRNTLDSAYDGMKKSRTVRIPCTDEQYADFWNFLSTQNEKPYDRAAILSFSPTLRFAVKDRHWQDESAWFCSELQLAALVKAGILYLTEDTVVDSFSPRDLWVMLAQKVGYTKVKEHVMSELYDKLKDETVVDFKAGQAAPAVENQAERIERELDRDFPERPRGLKAYILSKAKEFETLRKQYETQVAQLQFELKRIRESADGQDLHSMREGYKARDREWLSEIGKMEPEAQIAIGEDGLIMVRETLTILENIWIKETAVKLAQPIAEKLGGVTRVTVRKATDEEKQ